jgi:hypothetical protein
MIYADDRDAILVTSNRNCALAAPRKGVARAVWLDCVEEYALDTNDKARAPLVRTADELAASGEGFAVPS